MAIPMCAAFKAGPSFTPSPVIATISLFALSALMMRNLASGNMRVKMKVLFTFFFNSSSFNCINSSPLILSSKPLNPICCAMDEVVSALSPVIILTSIPAV